ncbi:MAG: NfeD family protein [Bacillota bacterium]|nr:MAG: hypothetical protein DIU70_13460 [Bacillota bacterium]
MTPALWVYIPTMVLGLGWLLLQNFAGGDGDHHPDAGDLSPEAADHPEAGDGGTYVSPLKPVVLATTLAIFGASGSLLTWARALQPVLVALVAVALSFLAGWLVFRVLVFLARAQSSATEAAAEFIGLEGELTVGCSDQSLGEVVFDTGRSIQQFSARPYRPGETLPRGTRVVIRRIAGSVAYVERR